MKIFDIGFNALHISTLTAEQWKKDCEFNKHLFNGESDRDKKLAQVYEMCCKQHGTFKVAKPIEENKKP